MTSRIIPLKRHVETDLIIVLIVLEVRRGDDGVIRALGTSTRVFLAAREMVYRSDNKEIARKAIAAFSDWKQPWMDNCDGQMGRKLWGLFESSGNFRGKPDSFNLIETTYEKGKYGFDRMLDIAKIADKSGIRKKGGEYEKLHNELIENNAGTIFL